MQNLQKIGALNTRRLSETRAPRLGIGLEKLDRALYDPQKTYARIAELGVKWVRVQSGWARTEKTEGAYDFEWLDDIINALRARDLTPWMCLCYGNPVYTPMAAEIFGAVGCPPVKTEREKLGWARYVRALVNHMGERVTYYEIWNEPDGEWCWKTGVDAAEYGAFVKATSDAIRSARADARVIGGALCRVSLPFLERAFKAGMAGAVDALSYHRYRADETAAADETRALRAFLDDYDPRIKLIQGESGAQSSPMGAGAMAGGAWDELKQAKHLLRQRIVDLSEDIYFTSHFSCVDMAEALNGVNAKADSYKDYGYFGVLSAQFDENGRSTGDYAPKPAYYALQNLAALLGDKHTRPARMPILRVNEHSPRLLGNDCALPVETHAFERGGKRALCYWRASPLLTETYDGTISFSCARFKGAPALLDLLSGAIYALPGSMNKLSPSGEGKLINLPLTDAPLVLLEQGFLSDIIKSDY